MSEAVLVERPADGVALIRICRPEVHNALNAEVRSEIARQVQALDAEEGVRAIVISGGDKVFAAGADLVELRQRSLHDKAFRASRESWAMIEACRIPIIAAVNGLALGGGCELALHCDIIIAGESASLGQPEIKLGIMPGAGGTQRFLRAVGKFGAMRYLLTGDGAILAARSDVSTGELVEGLDETVTLARVTAAPASGVSDARASLLIAAYLTGIAQAATDMAVEYAKTRQQFGQPIGAFQAIKHMCADMATRAAAADAQVFYAAVTFEAVNDPVGDIAAARMLAADAALANGKANIQIHGGMGFTAECDAHLLLKRAQLMARLGATSARLRGQVLAG